MPRSLRRPSGRGPVPRTRQSSRVASGRQGASTGPTSPSSTAGRPAARRRRAPRRRLAASGRRRAPRRIRRPARAAASPDRGRAADRCTRRPAAPHRIDQDRGGGRDAVREPPYIGDVDALPARGRRRSGRPASHRRPVPSSAPRPPSRATPTLALAAMPPPDSVKPVASTLVGVGRNAGHAVDGVERGHAEAEHSGHERVGSWRGGLGAKCGRCGRRRGAAAATGGSAVGPRRRPSRTFYAAPARAMFHVEPGRLLFHVKPARSRLP